MKVFFALMAAALICSGCTHKVTEQDILGTYVTDPAHKNQTDVEKKMEITFGADHKFAIATATPVNIDGTWTFDESNQKIGVTPVNVDIKNPQTGQETKMTMDQMKQLLLASGSNSQQEAELDKISKGSFFEPKEGGKKLYENGEPTLIKKGS